MNSACSQVFSMWTMYHWVKSFFFKCQCHEIFNEPRPVIKRLKWFGLKICFRGYIRKISDSVQSNFSNLKFEILCENESFRKIILEFYQGPRWVGLMWEKMQKSSWHCHFKRYFVVKGFYCRCLLGTCIKGPITNVPGTECKNNDFSTCPCR